MPVTARLWRSVLYVPASNARAMDKARTVPADAILFDLEDAVAPDAKAMARDLLARVLGEGGFGPRAVLVRVNGADTPWGAADLAAVAAMPCDGVVLPKVADPADLDVPLPQPVWAMLETARGCLNAAAIAAHPRLEGMIMGTNDLARELGSRGRAALLPVLAQCLLAARAEGRVILDGVYNAFQDAEGLAAECVQGRDMGFDGKTLIHPSQVATANLAFAPSAEDVALARRQIAAWNAAQADGRGVAVVDGKIVENLHILTAQGVLAKAAAIAERVAA
jgi:(3S)-malyl-CoA thioesterase